MYVVIVVGPVDSVDRLSNTQDVGYERLVTLGCWTGHRYQSQLFVWRDTGNFSTMLSTRKVVQTVNPHLGRVKRTCPYMGVPIFHYLDSFP